MIDPTAVEEEQGVREACLEHVAPQLGDAVERRQNRDLNDIMRMLSKPEHPIVLQLQIDVSVLPKRGLEQKNGEVPAVADARDMQQMEQERLRTDRPYPRHSQQQSTSGVRRFLRHNSMADASELRKRVQSINMRQDTLEKRIHVVRKKRRGVAQQRQRIRRRVRWKQLEERRRAAATCTTRSWALRTTRSCAARGGAGLLARKPRAQA